MSKAKTHRLMPATTFAGRFHVEAAIGEGAMGTVYKATLDDGSACALKVLKPHVAENQLKSTERFAREAKSGDRIGDPHVVKVFDTGHDEETGLHWLAMEFLDGLPLTQYLEEHRPSAEVRRALLDDLFGAIAAAHRAGVVHRDLKPDNLFVVDIPGEPTLKVLDFGVAKMLRDGLAASQTEGGLGTPLWTAPEQGKGGDHIRPSSDIWALGLLTFYLFTGKLFWFHANGEGGNMLDISIEMLRAPIPAGSARAKELEVADRLPTKLDRWFERTIVRDVNARYDDAGQAWDALRRALGELPDEDEPLEAIEPHHTMPPTQRRGAGPQVPVGMIVSVVAAIVVALAVVGWFLL